MGATEQLARFVVDTKLQDIPQEAVERANITFLDIIGVALAGTVVEETGQMAIRFTRDIGGTAEATVIGGGFRTSAPNAALVNGLLAHALDFDDWELTGGHPSSMLVAACLALGEKHGLAGSALIEAYIIGLEVYDRLSTGCPGAQNRGWHGAAVFGTMGATAAGAKLLGLTVPETIMAFGIAASSASGLARQHGNMTKPVQIGKAARNGVEAALLAKYGFTSDDAIIENPKGFCDAYLGEGICDCAKMIQNLGNPLHILSPGVGIKFYPCRYPEFRMIDAVLALRKEHGFTYDDVERVEIHASPHKLKTTILEPETGLQGKFSTKYICARALLDGEITLSTFSDEKVREEKTKEALQKIFLIPDPTIPEKWLKARSPVTVRLKNKQVFSREVDIPKGDPRNPLPLDEVIAKYCSNASLVLAEQEVAYSSNLLQQFDQLEDLQELLSILRLRPDNAEGS